MTRGQLYDEIWDISAAGVARKYNLPYGLLMKICKEASIPIPPSGYFIKINFSKPVVKTPLPDSDVDMVTLSSTEAPKPTRKKAVEKPLTEVAADEVTETQKPENVQQPTSDSESESPSTEQDAAEETDNVETYTQWGQTYNVYKRDILYKEVWEKPVTEVAKKYGVSDVAIHKVCKALDVPTPPGGYWAKVYAGKPVTKTPLPKSNAPAQRSGIRTGLESALKSDGETLEFLEEEERALILAIADQIQLPDEGEKMHTKIIAHRHVLAEWNKSNKRSIYRGYNNEPPPFLAGQVAEGSLPRVFRIFGALIHAMEPLGCSLTDDLRFVVLDETVSLQISEAMDKIKHVNTAEENMQLLKYEDERKRHSYASQPNIRQYDHIYNGHITLTVQNTKRFRDSKSHMVEDRLGDILIQMYEASNALRKEREAREEAEHKRKEEERLHEERRKRYNAEVDRTLVLTNLAEDYDIACKIRRYISAVEASGDLDEETSAWIEWAKAKADWYDPTIAREDEFFGERDHEEDVDQKALKHKHDGYSWR